MKQTQSLDGKWEVTGYGKSGETLKLEADVPGMIHLDLEREGIIPPMFWRDNAEKCQWVENWTWEYRKSFTIDENQPLERAYLEFGGLDTYANINLNGIHVSDTSNAQIPFEFDVSKLLRTGNNLLLITFTPYQSHLNGKSMDYPAAFTSDRVWVRRMQCTFYWDWVGRFVTFGPWRSVNLNFYDKARLTSSFVWCADIAPTSASLNIEIETSRLFESDSFYPRAETELFDPDGNRVWRKEFRICHDFERLQADISQPRLWWPANYGEQPLYICRITLRGDDGEVLDVSSKRFGIRTVRVEQLQDQPGSAEEEKSAEICEEHGHNGGGSGFTLLINGTRILCKGANWVPADPFPCRVTKEKYERLVRLAVKGNLNILRCWGGGIYEDDAFYEACDRYGLMLNCDFQLACARYPEHDAEWLANYGSEVKKAVRRLREHAAIVWYAGDNENSGGFDWDDPNAPGMNITEKIYLPTLKELDTSRPFFPSSPFGGRTNESLVEGDSHMSYYYIFAKPTSVHPRDRMKRFCRFATESFTMGTPLFSTLRSFMTDEDIADPELKMFDYHLKDNPYKPDGINKTIFAKSRIASDWAFGEPDGPQKRIIQDAYQQYFWTDEAIMAVRRQKWYCSGIEFWMYNDCWPSASWSLVDWYSVPKAGWYGARHASAPTAVSIAKNDGEYSVWILNDSCVPAEGKLELFICGFDGKRTEVAAIPFSSRANENQIIAKYKASELPAELDCGNQLIAEISGAFGRHRSAFFEGWPKDMKLPVARLDYTIDSAEGTITFSSDSYVRAVSIDIRGLCEDNYFDLLPGETKTVKIECYDGATIEDAEIYWLNK